MGVQGFRALGVMFRGPDAAAVGHAHHQRHAEGPSGTIAHAGGVIDQLVQGRIREPGKLDLHHRLETADGHADGRTDDAGLGQGRVETALDSETALQSFGGPKYPAFPAHILAEDHDRGIRRHFAGQGVPDRPDQGQHAHPGVPPSEGERSGAGGTPTASGSSARPGIPRCRRCSVSCRCRVSGMPSYMKR